MSRSGKLVGVVLFLLYNYYLCSNCEVNLNDNNEAATFSKAAFSILQKKLGENSILTILVFSRNQNLFDDVIDKIIHQAQGTINVIVQKVKSFTVIGSFEFSNEVLRCNGTCLCLYALEKTFPLDAFYNFYDHNVRDNRLLMYIHKSSVDETLFLIQNSEGARYNPSRIHFLFDTTDKNFIDLVVIEPYTPQACSHYQSSVINRFSKQSLEWEKSPQPIDLIENFHGCEIYVIVFENYADGIDIEETETGKVVFSGYYVDILNEYAKIANVKLTLKLPSPSDLNFMSRGTTTVQLNLHPMRVMYGDNNVGSLIPLVHRELFFAIPPGEPYTDWEILLLAYDTPTWILISVTFAASFIMILIINFMPTFVRNFVFGTGVTTPYLNVLIAFFGLSQVTLPARNFARFLLTLFIIWCLIIRTGYLGLLFEFMQGDKRKPEIKTIKELFQHNFTFVLDRTGLFFKKQMEEFER